MPRVSRRVSSLLALALAGATVAISGPSHADNASTHSCPNAGDMWAGARQAGMATNPYEDESGSAQAPSTASTTLWPARAVSGDGTVDLDGDGKADAVSLIMQTSGDATVAIRRGYDGQVIWQWSPGAGQCYIGLGVMRIGKPARPGVVLAYAESGATRSTLHLTAIEPLTGKTLWTWAETPLQRLTALV